MPHATQLNGTLLHLTDFHFFTGISADVAKLPTPDEWRDHFEPKLEALIKEKLRDSSTLAILLGGDFADRGDPDGFNLFSNAWRKAVSDQRHVHALAVPGNHDVKWDSSDLFQQINVSSATDLKRAKSDGTYYKARFDEFRKFLSVNKFVGPLLPSKIENGSGLVLEPSLRDQKPLIVDETAGVALLAINSALRCGEFNIDSFEEFQKARSGFALSDKDVFDLFRHDIAFLGDFQRNKLQQLLEQHKLAQRHDLFKVALIHHHLVPFEKETVEHKPFEGMIDAQKVLELLIEHGFHVILTGHKHQDYETIYEIPAKGRILLLGCPNAFRNNEVVWRELSYQCILERHEIRFKTRLSSDKNFSEFVAYDVPDANNSNRTIIHAKYEDGQRLGVGRKFRCAEECAAAFNFDIILDSKFDPDHSSDVHAYEHKEVTAVVCLKVDNPDRDYDRLAAELRSAAGPLKVQKKLTKELFGVRGPGPGQNPTVTFQRVWEVYGTPDYILLATIEIPICEEGDKISEKIVEESFARNNTLTSSAFLIDKSASVIQQRPEPDRLISALVRVEFKKAFKDKAVPELEAFSRGNPKTLWVNHFVPHEGLVHWIEINCACGRQDDLSRAISSIERICRNAADKDTYIVKPSLNGKSSQHP